MGGGRKQAKRKNILPHIAFLVGLGTTAQADLITANDYVAADPLQAQLGQLLFYDKVLSGNKNIACATCHHHDLAGTDGLSLGIGEGGMGLGTKRTAGMGQDAIRKRVPRNAPALWNLGHKDVRVVFHDGRLTPSDLFGNGFNSPAEEWLPQGLDNIVAAQSLFPLTAQFEMAGNLGENDVTHATQIRIDRAWPLIADRVSEIEKYVFLFKTAFDDVETAGDIDITHIGNALGAFITTEWRSFDTPYDAFLRDGTPLPAQAEAGRALFFGKANCSSCHSGALLSDQSFHALALPAFGPGRTRKFDPIPRDVGRMGETNVLEDAYRFRTPMLRNVALTGPYGHNGAYPTLEGMIRHHLNPAAALQGWTKDLAQLPNVPEKVQQIDFVIQSDRREMARQASKIDITPIDLSDAEVDQLVAFMHALTDKNHDMRPMGKPLAVPSGIPVD
ncbi:cytochrome-c peroxidase [Nereida sp. MMG025]|uniref:cytochrome-c peroxidase n=1 Tax=Nereida sp. MMG025 TaxID=2909981 RepID=UPI001F1F6444|nr:cytochrome c peroxidase [Nereida sp. MMG025]MCF6443665.1 methylamine utilization protein MauG [Nereida sp. MMG025]